MKYCLLLTLSLIEECAENDISEFPVRGWNLDKNKTFDFIKEDYESEYSDGETEFIFELIEIEEGCYYTYRYHEGEDAKDEGYNCWIEFLNKESYKKGYGKYTNFKIKITKKEVA